MKTDVASRNLEAEKCDSKTPTESRVLRGTRRTLQPLQKAAGDKENLVGAGRASKQMPPVKEVTIVVADAKSSKKLKSTKTQEKKPVITAEDLTSEDGPSEGYWEVIAERRRKALEAALKENKELTERIVLLEEENAQCKIMLDETRALVETLTEILNEKNEETEDQNEE